MVRCNSIVLKYTQMLVVIFVVFVTTEDMSIKNVKQANIIVVTETDDTFQKIISLVQQSDNRNELINSTKRVVNVFDIDKDVYFIFCI